MTQRRLPVCSRPTPRATGLAKLDPHSRHITPPHAPVIFNFTDQPNLSECAFHKEFDKHESIPYHPFAMKRTLCILLTSASSFLLLLGGFQSPTRADDSSYVWPIEYPKRLSSMFADHRSFRFHSGIDVPTNGKTGYPVIACRSGYVYRLFASWQGYGKAVYLRLDDGRYAVYGHLSDFSPPLSGIVTEAQIEARRYRCDLFPMENEIRVKQGEVIGYSGESGWGGTHLHFELRDSTGCPINPLTSGFSVKDELPPRIRSVAIRPLEVWARVNGSAGPVTFRAVSDPGGNVYRLGEIPLVEGEIGMEVSVSDKMDDSRFTFGVYRLELLLDDSLVFSSRYDRFSFENTHKIELDRNFELRRRQSAGFYRLYVEEGNDLPIYDPAGGRMKTQTFEPGPHKAAIKVSDPSGNMSILSFTLIFDQSPAILYCSWDRKEPEGALKVGFHDPDDQVQEIVVEKSGLGESTWQEMMREKVGRPDGESVLALSEDPGKASMLRIAVVDSLGAHSEYNYLPINLDRLERPKEEDSLELVLKHHFKDNLLVIDLEFDQTLRALPQLSLVFEGFDFDPLFLEQQSEKSYRAVFPYYMTQPQEVSLSIAGVNLYGDSVFLNQVIPVAIITRESGGTVTSGDRQAKVEFRPEAVYHDLNVSIELVERSETRHKLVGKAYSFEPSVIPLDKRAKISLKYPELGCEPDRLGLYELVGESSYRFLGQKLDSLEGSVSAQVRYLSRYALLEDTLPPKITRVSIPEGMKIKAKKPKITATLKDDLSGIVSDEQVVVEIDGKWMIPEYDPEKQILVVQPLSPLSAGKHLLTIWVRDRAGNETEVKREFFVTGN